MLEKLARNGTLRLPSCYLDDGLCGDIASLFFFSWGNRKIQNAQGMPCTGYDTSCVSGGRRLQLESPGAAVEMGRRGNGLSRPPISSRLIMDDSCFIYLTLKVVTGTACQDSRIYFHRCVVTHCELRGGSHSPLNLASGPAFILFGGRVATMAVAKLCLTPSHGMACYRRFQPESISFR